MKAWLFTYSTIGGNDGFGDGQCLEFLLGRYRVTKKRTGSTANAIQAIYTKIQRLQSVGTEQVDIWVKAGKWPDVGCPGMSQAR